TNASGTDSSEWTKAYTDGAGRSYKTLYAAASSPYPATISSFNAYGQLVSTVDPDGAATLYAYNGKGEQVRAAVDMNQNGAIDVTDGDTGHDDDRITDTIQDSLQSRSE